MFDDNEKVLDAMSELALIDGAGEQEGCDKLVMALGQFPRIAALLEAVASDIVHWSGSPINDDRVRSINATLDLIRPCPQHGEWPDPYLGCIGCLMEAEAEAAMHAEEWASDCAEDR